jgi:hypothetical protein
MKFYFIRSSGELEAAIVSIANGYTGWIFDFSTEASRARNKKILNIFKDLNIRNYSPPKNIEKIMIIMAILLRGLVISLNSHEKSKFMEKIYIIFNISFIRDALIPRVSSGEYINLFCENKFKLYYPLSRCIELSDDGFWYFIEKISRKINSNKNLIDYDCILVGKSMKRSDYGLKLKKDLYITLSKKFKKVGVIPHPRECDEEIEIIKESGLDSLGDLIYSLKEFNGTVIVLSGSSGQIFELLGIRYYYISLGEFFIYGDPERIAGCANVIAEIKNLEELSEFVFDENFTDSSKRYNKDQLVKMA